MRLLPLLACLALGASSLALLPSASALVGGSCSTAVPVAPFDARVGQLSPAPDADWYAHAAPTRAASYRVSQLNQWLDVSLSVYDASCATLLCSDQTALPFKLEAACALDHVGSGSYRVKVASVHANDGGNYLVEFAIAEGDALEHQPRSQPNGDGTCTTYDDRDLDNAHDPDEAGTTHACPKPGVAVVGGSVVLYDDRDRDGALDPGETLLATPPDADGDGVFDFLEPQLCARENPFLKSDGTCQGPDYAPPTPAGVLEDAEDLLP